MLFPRKSVLAHRARNFTEISVNINKKNSVQPDDEKPIKKADIAICLSILT
ncbi:hypothetical protein SOASR032_21880 [Pragia fontium]|uniref:Uncharacterized protein n=1 Tax=Pragia fontium TaxID=82985 RepID=A0ABQ5LK64_9GAMM|nr:hypothetical protein SOASR032_21880 [Pragia fontium]